MRILYTLNLRTSVQAATSDVINTTAIGIEADPMLSSTPSGVARMRTDDPSAPCHIPQIGKTSDGRAPLSCGQGTAGFLVPVDSFASFFGKSGAGDGKRTDLLAVQLVLPSHGSGKMRISTCGTLFGLGILAFVVN